MLWADPDCRDLCPVTHILVHLYHFQIKAGYLFPSQEELVRLRGDHSDHVARQHIGEGQFLTSMTTLCYALFGRNYEMGDEPADGEEDMSLDTNGIPRPKLLPRIFGTHTCKKTTYMIAIMNKASQITAMHSHRHTTVSSAIRYWKDCETLFEMLKLNKKLPFVKPIWKSFRIDQVDTARRTVEPSRFQSVLELATFFMERTVKFPRTHPRYSIKNAMEEAVKVRSYAGCKEDLVTSLRSAIPSASQLEEILKMLDVCLTRRDIEQSAERVTGNFFGSRLFSVLTETKKKPLRVPLPETVSPHLPYQNRP